jgi:hypothetical protein
MMFGMGDNDEEQRFWNLIMFKIPLTDEEMEDTAPAIVVLFLILVVVIGLIAVCH